MQDVKFPVLSQTSPYVKVASAANILKLYTGAKFE